uniref:Dynein heavy chain putative n=1 Tax=Albugo laibachii Nc14 TaxID=890382 RepID=F0WEM7_9STRA|nr:dynein heavy chain putative [Albugo laibachii Nc14]|eukprot:CCA19659.1 dynein heavy chain putative [Albugo laibachii Nc14]
MERPNHMQTVTEKQIFYDQNDGLFSFDQDCANQGEDHGLGSHSNTISLPLTNDRLTSLVHVSDSQALLTAWNFLSDWVRAQLAMDAPASIPGFGTITQQRGDILTFEPEQAFLKRYSVAVERAIFPVCSTQKTPEIIFEHQKGHDADLLLFDYVEMSACCAFGSDRQAKFWLDMLLQRLGAALGHHSKIELDIGSGIICCKNKKISRHMKQKKVQGLDLADNDPLTEYALVRYCKMDDLTLRSRTDTCDLAVRFPSRPSAIDHASVSQDSTLRNHTRRPKDFELQRKESPRQIKINRNCEIIKKQHTSSIRSSTRDESSCELVPLFDCMGQTLCVEPDIHIALASSNRIGANYTPTAMLLCINRGSTAMGITLQNHVVDHGDVNERHTAVEVDKIEASERKYFKYLDEPDERNHLQWQISPPSCDFIDRIFQASKRQFNASPYHSQYPTEQSVLTLKEELARRYIRSTRKAVLNYILLRDATKMRLQIYQGAPISMVLPSKFVWNDVNGDEYGCLSDLKALASTPSTKAPIFGFEHTDCMTKEIISSRSLTTLPWILSSSEANAVLQMSNAILDSIEIFILPSVETLSSYHSCDSGSQGAWSLNLVDFKTQQIDHAKQAKERYMNSWHSQAAQLLYGLNLQHPKSPRSLHYEYERALASMTVLMVLQVQRITSRSIEAFLRFLSRFDYEADLSGTIVGSNSEDHFSYDSAPLTGFLVALELDGVQVRLCIDHEDISDYLVETFQLAISIFQSIPSLRDPITAKGCNKSSFPWQPDRIYNDHSKAINEIRRVCEKHVVFLENVCQRHTKILALYQNPALREALNDPQQAACDTDVCREAIQKLNVAAARLTDLSKSVFYLNLFFLDCSEVQVKMREIISEWFHRISSAYEEVTAQKIYTSREGYENISKILENVPKRSLELPTAEVFIKELRSTKLQELEAGIKEIQTRLHFIILECHEESFCSNHQSHKDTITTDVLAIYKELTRWPSKINKAVNEADTSLALVRIKFEAAFQDHRLTFNQGIERLAGQITALSGAGDLIYSSMYAIQACAIQERLLDDRNTLYMLMEEEKALGMQIDWAISLTLDDLLKTSGTLKKVWETIRDFQELSGRLSRSTLHELASDSDRSIFIKMVTTLTECNHVSCSGESAVEAVKNILEQARFFLDIIKLVKMLLHPSMEARHRNEITELLGMHFDDILQSTPLTLMENGVMEQISKVGRICELALFEKQLEGILQEITLEWRGVGFVFSTQRHRILRGVNEDVPSMILSESGVKDIESLIQDHQIRLEMIQCLGNSSVLNECREEWISFFDNLQILTHKLCVCNRQWLSLRSLYCKSYFSGIFCDDDVFMCAKWESVREAYLGIIHGISLHPQCIYLVPAPQSLYIHDGSNADGSRLERIARSDVSVKSRQLIESIDQICSEMGAVHQRLRIVLDRTCELFPRLHFLSDLIITELLSHLSVINDQFRTRELSVLEGNVSSVRKHSKQIKSCFPGADSLQLDAKSQQITGMVSSQGELFSVASPITTKNVPVTQWLQILEKSMHRAIHASLRAAMHELNEKGFRKWCISWPEQVVLCSICHFWTFRGEAANRALNSDPASQNETWISRKPTIAWSHLVEDLGGKLCDITNGLKLEKRPHRRKAFEDIIILLRHLHDVSIRISKEAQSMENMVSHHLENKTKGGKTETAATLKEIEIFEGSTWLLQPRYYYEEKEDLTVRMMHTTSLFYGYEYLGNESVSFSVKPLTLRYSLALFQSAVHLRRNCCFESDVVSSIGIPTLVRELSKFCGRLWINFSCQDLCSTKCLTLQYDKLVHFVKGAASTGAWLVVENTQKLGKGGHLISRFTSFVQLCAKISKKVASKSPSCEFAGSTISLHRGVQFIMLMNSEGFPSTTMERMLGIARSHFHSIQANLPDFEILVESLLTKAEFGFSRATIPKLSAMMETLETDLLEGCACHGRGTGTDRSAHFRPFEVLVRIIGRAIQLQSTLLENLIIARYRDTSLDAFGTREKENSLRAQKHVEEARTLIETKQIMINEGTRVAEVQKLESLSLARGAFEILRPIASSTVMKRALELLQQIHPDFEQEVVNISLEPVNVSIALRDQYTKFPSHHEKSHTATNWLEVVENGSSLEDVVTKYADTSSVCRASDVFLSAKTRQLCEVLQLGRIVIVSGEIQAGKSGVIKTLLEACNTLYQISQSIHEVKDRMKVQEKANGAPLTRQKHFRSDYIPPASSNNEWYYNRLVASTIQVVIMHQATTWKQFTGLDSFIHTKGNTTEASSEQDAVYHPRTLFAQMIWDAVVKHHRNGIHTWLTLDGSIDSSLCEWLIKYTGNLVQKSHCELLDESYTQNHLLPDFIRIIVETEDLSNLSPSILSSIGYVNVLFQEEDFDQEVPMWHDLFFSWKRKHEASGTFNSSTSEVLSMLDDLMKEVVTESLRFADANLLSSKAYLQYPRKECYRKFRTLSRIRQTLEFFEVFLRHQWKEWTALTSLKRKVSIASFCVQALVWGVGNTYDRIEQAKFQSFLRQFASKSAQPTTDSATSVKGILLESFIQRDLAGNIAEEKSVYNFGFKIESGKLIWMEWVDYYLHWLESILSSDYIKSDEHQKSDDTPDRKASLVRHRRASSRLIPGCRVVSKQHSKFWLLVSKYKKDKFSSLRMPNSNAVVALCLLDQVMSDDFQFSALISGPTGSGKTRLGIQYLTSRKFSHHSSIQSALSCEAPDRRPSDLSAEYQHVQLSSGSTAEGLIYQMMPFVMTHAHQIYRKNCISGGSPVFLFFDDIHTGFPDDESCKSSQFIRMNVSIELVRMVIDQRKLILSRTYGNIGEVPGLKVFASRSISDARLARDRMSHKFVDIAMPELSDQDLSDICTEIISDYIPLPGTSHYLEGSVSAEHGNYISKFARRVALASVCIFPSVYPSFEMVNCHTSKACSLQKLTSKSEVGRVTSDTQPLSLVSTQNRSTCEEKSSSIHPGLQGYFVEDYCQLIRRVCIQAIEDQSETNARQGIFDEIRVATEWCYEVDKMFGYRLFDTQSRQVLLQNACNVASSNFEIGEECITPRSIDCHSKHRTLIEEIQKQLWQPGSATLEKYNSAEMFSKAHIRPKVPGDGHFTTLVPCEYVFIHVARFVALLRTTSVEGLRQHSVVMAYGVRVLDLMQQAASICKTRLVVFNGQFKSADYMRWIAFFKEIILQCVSLHLSRLCEAESEPTLLVFEDDGRGHHQASYQVMEWFARGMHRELENSLLSYQELSPKIVAGLKSELQSQQQKLSGDDITSMGITSSNVTIMKLFYTIAQRRLHIAVIMTFDSTQMGRTEQLRQQYNPTFTATMKRYHHFFKACNISFCGPWPGEALLKVAEKNFEELPQIRDQERQLYASVAFQFLQEARKEPEMGAYMEDFCWYESASVVYPDLINHHLSIFVAQYERIQCHVRLQLEKYRATLDFFDELEKELAAQNTHLESLRDQHQQKSALTWESYGNLKKEELAIIKAQKQVEIAKNLYRLQVERVDSIEQECDRLLQHEALFAHQHKRVKILADTILFIMERSDEEHEAAEESNGMEFDDVERNIESTFLNQFPRMYNIELFGGEQRAMTTINSSVQGFLNLPSQPIYPVFFHLCECLARLLQIEPHKRQISVEQDNTFDDYLTAVKVHMQRPDFWVNIRDLQISLIEESVQSRVFALINSMDLNLLQNPPLHPFVSILFDFVKAAAISLRDRASSGLKVDHLREERKRLHQSQLHISSVEGVNKSHQSGISDAEKLRQHSELARECLVEEIGKITMRIKQLEALKNATRDKKQNIQCRYEKLIKASEEWIGDLLMATAMMTYPETFIHRLDLIKCWDEILTASSIRHNSIWVKGGISLKMTKHLQELFQLRNVALSEWYMHGLPTDDPKIVFNAIKILHTRRIPCLVDPSGVATKWIKDVLIGKRACVMSCAAYRTSPTCSGLFNPAFADDNCGQLSASGINEKCPLCSTFKQHHALQHRILLEDLDENAAFHLRFLFQSCQRLLSRSSSSQAGFSDSKKKKKRSLRQSDDLIHPIYVSLSSQSICTLQEGRCWIKIPAWLHPMDRELHLIYIQQSDWYLARSIERKMLDGTGSAYLITQMDLLKNKIITCEKELDILDDQLLSLLTESIDKKHDIRTESEHLADVWSLSSTEELSLISNRVITNQHAYESNLLEKRGFEHTVGQVRIKLKEVEGLATFIMRIQKAWTNVIVLSLASRLTAQRQDASINSRLTELAKLQVEESLCLPRTWILTLVRKIMKQYSTEMPCESVCRLFLAQASGFMTSHLKTHQEIFQFNVSVACEMIKQDISSLRLASVEVFEEFLQRLMNCLLYWNASGDTPPALAGEESCDRSIPDLDDLRPNGMGSQEWRLVKYLSRKCDPLREFVIYVDKLPPKSKQRIWGALLNSKSSDWYTDSTPSGLSWCWMELDDALIPPPSSLALHSIAHSLVRISLSAIFGRQNLLKELKIFNDDVGRYRNKTGSPDSILDMELNAGQKYRSDVSQFDSRRIKEVWNISSSSQPLTMIATSSEHEALSHISAIAGSLGITTIQADKHVYAYLDQSISDKSVSPNAVTSSCGQIRSWLLPATGNGNWIIFLHADVYLAEVSKAIEQMEKFAQSIDNIHENFRIWFIKYVPENVQSAKRNIWSNWSIFQNLYVCELHRSVHYELDKCLIGSAEITIEKMKALSIDTKYERYLVLLAIYHGILMWLINRTASESISDSDLWSFIDIAIQGIIARNDGEMGDSSDSKFWSQVSAAAVTVYQSKMMDQEMKQTAETLLHFLVATVSDRNCYCIYSVLPSIYLGKVLTHVRLKLEEFAPIIAQLKAASLDQFAEILNEYSREIYSIEAGDIADGIKELDSRPKRI